MENSNKRGGPLAWDTKYNYGKPIDTDVLTPEEYRQCAIEWSEGDENLEQLLYTCLIKGIKTVACCTGHNGEMSRGRSWHPYITFEIDEKNEIAIDSIATYFKDYEGIKIMYFADDSNRTARVVFHFPKGTNTEVFSQMNEICNAEDKEIDNIFSVLRETVKQGKVDEIYYRKGEVLDEFHLRQDVEIDKERSTNGCEDKSTYHFLIKKNSTEQYYKGCEEISEILNEFDIKNEEENYLVSDESLEHIAKKPKELSIKDFFYVVKERVRKFLGIGKTNEENIKGE